MIDSSGIRKVFDLAASIKDPVNLSIGQPDFPVPDLIKRTAVKAIDSDLNRYTLTQGIPQLRELVHGHYKKTYGFDAQNSIITPLTLY